jgi:hypothetical protein
MSSKLSGVYFLLKLIVIVKRSLFCLIFSLQLSNLLTPGWEWFILARKDSFLSKINICWTIKVYWTYANTRYL